MSGSQPTDADLVILRQMEDEFDAIVDDMLRRARTVPIYAAYSSPEFLAAAHAHCSQHMHAYLTVARERRPLTPDELTFVTDQAALRAGQGVALDPMLQVYRMGHEAIFHAIMRIGDGRPDLTAGVVALTALTLPHVDMITKAFTDAYLDAAQGAEASATEAERRDLIDEVLRGSVGADDAEARARSIGVDVDGPFVVVVGGAPPSASVDADALRALARAVASGSLLRPDRALLAVVREREVVALFPWKPPHTDVRARVDQALADVGAGTLAVGAGLPCHRFGELQRGYAEAWSMLRRARPGEVRWLGDLGPAEYLALTADETSRRLIDEAVRATLERDHEQGGPLLETLRAFAACDLNAAATGQRLHLHANTVRYRLAKVHRDAGRDPARFADLRDLLTAADVLGF